MSKRKGSKKIKFFGNAKTIDFPGEGDEELEIELVPGQWFNPFNGYLYEDKAEFLKDLGGMLEDYQDGLEASTRYWLDESYCKPCGYTQPYFKLVDQEITDADSDWKRGYTSTLYVFELCDGSFWGYEHTEGVTDYSPSGLDAYGVITKTKRTGYKIRSS